jgi:phosphoglycerol transferase MdoB-like AlkP superfamily enzyme
MPKHLRIACLLFIAGLCGMAVLAPLYESGVARVTSPIFIALFAVVVALFMRRVQWTWLWMQWIAFVEIVINALFFPTPKFHGVYAGPARILIAVQMAACCVILWSLVRHQDSRAWFTSREA